jgi:hypothetical protein
MKRGTTVSTSEAIGTFRTEIPPLADREPCIVCEIMPAEYHQPGGPGTVSVRGYCVKCQAVADSEGDARDQAKEEATARKIEQAANAEIDPLKRKQIMRRYNLRVRAVECRAASGGTCRYPRSKGAICNHCDVTSDGYELYRDTIDSAPQKPAKRTYQDTRRRP